MDTTKVTLDKQFLQELEEDLGKIAIRVVVFAKADENSPKGHEQPEDLDVNEDFSSIDPEANSYLELPKRGKMYCVFLVNGQRHDSLDNSFVVSELNMKYLRKRMIIVVDLDGLSQNALGQILRGSRTGFYKGAVYYKIYKRLVATLQNDPDLIELEEEAEDQLAQLQTGEVVVQQALDKLIENHVQNAERSVAGKDEPGYENGEFFASHGKTFDTEVVAFGENGIHASEPVLFSNYAAETLRLLPAAVKKLRIFASPTTDWDKLEDIQVHVSPNVLGLECALARSKNSADLNLEFTEPTGFDDDVYPIKTRVKILARFKDKPEMRLIEKGLVIRPTKKPGKKPVRELFDTPTYIKVTSQQPVRLIPGGADVHVKISWDGKDYLATDSTTKWRFSVLSPSHPNMLPLSYTKPTNGRFEVLIHAPEGILIGTKMTFEIQALGPENQVLSTSFIIEVVEAPGTRKLQTRLTMSGQRHPPYKLVYVHEKDFASPTRWGEDTWDVTHAAAFIEPRDKSPLTLCINQDFGLLRKYVDTLIGKQADEQRTSEKKTKYVSHVAYHLYQMYVAKEKIKKQKQDDPDNKDIREPQDDELQMEIDRVAATLVRLMEVTR